MPRARIRVRRLREADIEPLYKLYLSQERLIPYQPKTRYKQFAEGLRTSRAYPDKKHYDAKAEIAVVAEVNGKVVAYANGCKVIDARGLVRSGQAYLRFVLGTKEHAEAVCKVIRRTTHHLLKFEPDQLQAFSSFIAPVFLGFSGGKLPSSWSWLGQCLRKEGYAADNFGVRMLRPLSGRGMKPKPLTPPKGGKVIEAPRFDANGLEWIDQKYVVRHYVRDVAICENYYSGAFVKGSGHQYLFTLWVTAVPPNRGKGYGRYFIRNALVIAYEAGAKAAMLITSVHNFISQTLYRSEGYETVDTICSFTYKGE